MSLSIDSTLPNDSPSADLPDGFFEQVQTVSTVANSGNTYLNSVLYGTKWNGPLNYSFPDGSTTAPWVPYTHSADGITQVSFEQRQAVRQILDGSTPYAGGPKMLYGSYESVSNLNFTEVANSSTASDIVIAQCNNFDGSNLNTARVADFPEVSAPNSSGDVWFGDDGNQYRDPVLGTFSWVTHIHELGHAVGLKHPHQSYGAFGTLMPADRDSLEFSVMTYRNYIGGPTDFFRPETYGAPQTLMMYDILALQYLYGADYGTNSGDTTYRWDPNTGEMFVNGVAQGQPGGNRVFLTIWDGNGTDTYDMSNYTNGVNINLMPGMWSITSAGQLANLDRFVPGHYAQGNVYNSLLFNGDTRSLIENAYGGSGNDRIVGNQAKNLLHGNNGDDLMWGGAGNDDLRGGAGRDLLWGEDGDDVFVGGLGADVFTGGTGRDGVAYQTSNSAVDVHLANNVGKGGEAEGDRYGSIENLIGSPFDDTLVGDNGDNWIYGLDGDDRIWGGTGDDLLIGTRGRDILTGGPGKDATSYHNADDSVRVVLFQKIGRYSDAEGDRFGSIEDVNGSQYSDELFGDNADNEIWGNGGNDNLYGQSGNDTLDGGNGNDKLFGQDGNDILFGRAGIDRYVGGSGADQFVFTSASDSSVANPDEVVDFTTAHGDKINLAGIDANTGAGGDQAFNFIGTAAFTGVAGQLHYIGGRFLEGDVNGDGVADFVIQFNTGSLAVGDFIL